MNNRIIEESSQQYIVPAAQQENNDIIMFLIMASKISECLNEIGANVLLETRDKESHSATRDSKNVVDLGNLRWKMLLKSPKMTSGEAQNQEI